MAGRPSLASFAILSVLWALSASCTQTRSPSAEPEVIVRDRLYDATLDRVWDAVLASYAAMKIPVEEGSREAGRVKSRTTRAPTNMRTREYMDCGSSGVLGYWQDQPNFNADYVLATLLVEPE